MTVEFRGGAQDQDRGWCSYSGSVGHRRPMAWCPTEADGPLNVFH